jgi:alcohol dehydrogenase class IV
VGGGSAIVTPRAASILLAEAKSAHELSTVITADGKVTSPRLDASKIPQVIIPTTPTTAIVKAGSAVFDTEAKARLAMFDPKTRAQSVFIHPDFVASAPAELVISASLNTLAMAIEGLMAKNGDPIADGQLMQALRLSLAGLETEARSPSTATRGNLVVAAMLSGQGTDHTGAGIVTVLGHAIGMPFGIDNGVANAVALPHTIPFNAPYAEAGLVKVGIAMGITADSSQSLLEAIVARLSRLLETLGIPQRLRDLGVPSDALSDIADHAMGDWFLRGNPRPISQPAEIAALLSTAW